MAEYNVGDKFIVEIINKTDEPLSPYISGTTKNVTVYRLKGIPFMLDADTLSNFERFEERKKGKNIATDYDEVDQFVCSECGIELQNWVRVERDEDDGDETHHEYRFNFCPNCGAEMSPTLMSGTKEET